MMHASSQIGVAENARGLLISLPPQLPLAVSLRKTFKGCQAAEAPWTYLVPRTRFAARQLEEWIAEVELQARAAARLRAWSALDAEWEGTAARPAPAAPPAPAEPLIVTLPRKRTAKAVLALLDVMARGAALVVAVRDGHTVYRLSTTGRRVERAIATRVIAERLVLPGMDGLFGPEWSQTFRSATPAEISAAKAAAAQKRRRRPARASGRPAA